MSLRKVRDELKELRQAVEQGGGQQIFAVGNEREGDEVRRRLRPDADALIIITGISRATQ
jgi:hypothetical protein